jgi:hypothetical protein
MILQYCVFIFTFVKISIIITVRPEIRKRLKNKHFLFIVIIFEIVFLYKIIKQGKCFDFIECHSS